MNEAVVVTPAPMELVDKLGRVLDDLGNSLAARLEWQTERQLTQGRISTLEWFQETVERPKGEIDTLVEAAIEEQLPEERS